MNNDKTNSAETNVDDLIMDSMLRQFVNSEVQRFRFAEQVNAAIRESQQPEFKAVETDDQQEDWSVEKGQWHGGPGRMLVKAASVAAIAATLLLAIWLPNRQDSSPAAVAGQDLSARGPVAHTAELKSRVPHARNQQPSPPQIAAESKQHHSNKSVLAKASDESEKVCTSATDLHHRSPKHTPFRSELIMSTDFQNGASAPVKIVRAEPAGAENKATDQNQPVPVEVFGQVTAGSVQQMDATLFPNRELVFEVDISDRTNAAYVSINDEKIPMKMRFDSLSQGLKLLEPEISRRMRFIGPRVGNIVGSIRYKSNAMRFALDFENERQLRSAITRICDRLEEISLSVRKRNHRNSTSPSQFLNVALKKTNEAMRLWAKDSLEMGNVSLEPDFESESRFQRVISKTSLQRFATTGYFQIPEPEEIYLPTTRLQYLEPDNLRKDLKVSTRQLDLFKSDQEMKEFASKHSGRRKKSGRSRNTSIEPLKKLLDDREDLQGLPLVMGDDCHMDQGRSQKMEEVSRTVGPILNQFDRFASRNVNLHSTARRQMLNQQIQNVKQYFSRTSRSPQELLTLDQMLQIEDTDMRIELVKLLEESRSPMSASLLAAYAKFDLSPRVRVLATSALSGFPRSFFRHKLLDGMRYPWPEAAKHSAEALVRLNDTESIPKLVDMLKNPDPRTPTHENGKYVKKELVAINHLKNCMLCHADSQSVADRGQAPVPVWGQELPRTYYNFRSPGLLMARADVTYMRQDFSVVQEVEDAKPWPSHQRFDYVVQNRPLTKEQYEQLMLEQTMDSNTYEQAIVFALQMLTGKTPADNSYETWSEIVSQLPVLP